MRQLLPSGDRIKATIGGRPISNSTYEAMVIVYCEKRAQDKVHSINVHKACAKIFGTHPLYLATSAQIPATTPTKYQDIQTKTAVKE